MNNYSTAGLLLSLLFSSVGSLAEERKGASFLLEEVIVTAQKREQSIQDVGIAITAFSGDQLENLGYSNAQQITAMTPGVTTIQPNGPSSYFVSIRGVGQNDFSGDHQESPVAIYVDNAYISAASGAGFQLFDIERVEVLRGPQGTLFGRNATGGLVHYVTEKPDRELDGYVKATFGRYDQVKMEGALGGGINESISGRLSFFSNDHDAYAKNRIGKDPGNGDDWAVRGQILIKINENAEWLWSARAAEQDIDAGFFRHRAAVKNAETGLGEYFPDDVNANGTCPGCDFFGHKEPNNNVFEGAYDRVGRNELESQGITSTLTWNFDNLSFTSVTDFWHLEKDYIEDSDATPVPVLNFFLKSDLDQFSQELRLNGTSEGLRWVAGAFYMNIDGDFGIGSEFPLLGTGIDNGGISSGPAGLDNPFSTETKSYALFGQLELDLREDLTAILGLRWTKEKKEHRFYSNLVGFSPSDNDVVEVLAPLFLFDPQNAPNTGFDKDLVTAKVELDWRATDRTLVYASYNRGVKSGGFNSPFDVTDLLDPVTGAQLNDVMDFDEEILDAYEIGFKSSLADGRARLNGAIYFYDYQDYQAFNFNGLTQFVFNTDAEVSGVEVELQASPMEGLDILLGASYIDSHVEDAYQLTDGSWIDRTAVMTPKWNFNGLVRYEWPALGGQLALQADFTYMDEHFFQLKNAPVSTEDAYLLSNAKFSYTSGDQRWDVSAFVNNLSDKEYRLMAFDVSGDFGMSESVYGTPRWWGVSVAYHID